MLLLFCRHTIHINPFGARNLICMQVSIVEMMTLHHRPSPLVSPLRFQEGSGGADRFLRIGPSAAGKKYKLEHLPTSHSLSISENVATFRRSNGEMTCYELQNIFDSAKHCAAANRQLRPSTAKDTAAPCSLGLFAPTCPACASSPITAADYN